MRQPPNHRVVHTCYAMAMHLDVHKSTASQQQKHAQKGQQSKKTGRIALNGGKVVNHALLLALLLVGHLFQVKRRAALAETCNRRFFDCAVR